MAIVKSTPVKKYINGETIFVSENTVVSETKYSTTGESVVVVDGIDHCSIILDHNTTTHIVIKCLTNATISPLEGTIDKEWDDLEISKGSCVELKYILHNWYILSSDGLKLV